jgi:sulfatase modifying factor 1
MEPNCKYKYSLVDGQRTKWRLWWFIGMIVLGCLLLAGIFLRQLDKDRQTSGIEDTTRTIAEGPSKRMTFPDQNTPTEATAMTDRPEGDSGAKPMVLKEVTVPVIGETWIVPDFCMEMVYVAPGSFQMGSSDGDAYYHEKPVHTVHITKGFWIDRTEVTNGQYQRFVRESGYDGSKEVDSDYLNHFRGRSNMPTDAEYPVCWVSWHNAVAFSSWLTEQERQANRLPSGYVYRLPTEAEWEYAARGGTRSSGFTYAGSNNLDEVGWYASNSSRLTHKIGQKRSNELGLYDMSGNVWEWCHDWYASDYYAQNSSYEDPSGPSTGSSRVLRGGSWYITPGRCRSTDRHWCAPIYTRNHRGFRVVLSWRLESSSK